MRTHPSLARPLLVLALAALPATGHAAPRDRAPFISTIANTTVALGSGLGFSVSAVDPDGDAIASFVATNVPPNGSFTLRDATNTIGDFRWDPAFAGNFFPVFTACNGLCGSAKVFLTSCDGFMAYLTTAGSNQSLRLSGGANNTWCVQIQPNFQSTASQIVPSSIVLHSDGTGSVSQINADPSTTGALGDRTNDGIQEMTACFTRADLQRLFSSITAPTSAYVTVTASLIGGGTITGNLVLAVSP